jgi:toxin ParE1/3/4
MAKYNLSKLAAQDLGRIYEYGVLNFGVETADKYFQALLISFDKIAEQPLIFARVPDIAEDYRRCVSGTDSIYYEIIEESVRIVRIIGRQDLKTAF